MIMMGIYTLVLVGSALLASWLGLRLFGRIGRELALPPERTQLAISLSAIAFLTVVSMPAGVLIAALVLTALGFMLKPEWTLRSQPLWGMMLAAILLATVGVWDSPGQWPAPLPVIVALLLAAVIFAGMLEIARRTQPSVLMLGGITALATLPVMIAPLIFSDAHSSLAVDSAILLAALLGGMILLREEQTAAPLLRLPVALLIAYGAIQAMHYGAWPMGVATLAIFAGGLWFAPRLP